MKQNIKLRSITVAIMAALTLNACNMGRVANQQALHSQEKNASNGILANEHHIERPSDEKRKEEYDKIKDKVVVDNDANKPARQDQKDVIHQLLEKVPTVLSQQFNKIGGQIKLVNENWLSSLQNGGIRISSDDQVINKSGNPVHISDAIVYFDSSSLHPIIYINSNVNYVNNADNRKELEYSLVRGLLKSNNIILDKDFVNAVKSYTQVSGIEYYNYPELEAISQFSAEDIKLTENQDKMTTLFASIMADSIVNKEYVNVWQVITEFIDKVVNDKLADSSKEQSFPAKDIECSTHCSKPQIQLLEKIEIKLSKIFENNTQINFYKNIGEAIKTKEMAERIFQIKYENLPNFDDKGRNIIFEHLGQLKELGYNDAYQLVADPVLMTKPLLFEKLVEYAKKNNKLKSIWELREEYKETLPKSIYYRGMALSEDIKKQYDASGYLTPKLYREMEHIDFYGSGNNLTLPKAEERTDIFFNQYAVLTDISAENKSYLVPRIDLYGNLRALLTLHISPSLNQSKAAANLFGEKITDGAKAYPSEVDIFRKLLGDNYAEKNTRGSYKIADSFVRRDVNNLFADKITQFSALSSVTSYQEVSASAALIANQNSKQDSYIFKLALTELDFLNYSDIFPLSKFNFDHEEQEIWDSLNKLDNSSLEKIVTNWDKNEKMYSKKINVWKLAVNEKFKRSVEQFVFGPIKISEVYSIAKDSYDETGSKIKDYTTTNENIRQLLVEDGLLYK